MDVEDNAVRSTRRPVAMVDSIAVIVSKLSATRMKVNDKQGYYLPDGETMISPSHFLRSRSFEAIYSVGPRLADIVFRLYNATVPEYLQLCSRQQCLCFLWMIYR